MPTLTLPKSSCVCSVYICSVRSILWAPSLHCLTSCGGGGTRRAGCVVGCGQAALLPWHSPPYPWAVLAAALPRAVLWVVAWPPQEPPSPTQPQGCPNCCPALGCAVGCGLAIPRPRHPHPTPGLS